MAGQQAEILNPGISRTLHNPLTTLLPITLDSQWAETGKFDHFNTLFSTGPKHQLKSVLRFT
jgi:hypothetical protein